MTNEAVARYIRGYAGDRCVSEHRVPASWTLAKLQSLFGAPSGDPLYDSYPLGPEHSALLADALGRAADPQCAYFMETEIPVIQ